MHTVRIRRWAVTVGLSTGVHAACLSPCMLMASLIRAVAVGLGAACSWRLLGLLVFRLGTAIHRIDPGSGHRLAPPVLVEHLRREALSTPSEMQSACG